MSSRCLPCGYDVAGLVCSHCGAPPQVGLSIQAPGRAAAGQRIALELRIEGRIGQLQGLALACQDEDREEAPPPPTRLDPRPDGSRGVTLALAPAKPGALPLVLFVHAWDALGTHRIYQGRVVLAGLGDREGGGNTIIFQGDAVVSSLQVGNRGGGLLKGSEPPADDRVTGELALPLVRFELAPEAERLAATYRGMGDLEQVWEVLRPGAAAGTLSPFGTALIDEARASLAPRLRERLDNLEDRGEVEVLQACLAKEGDLLPPMERDLLLRRLEVHRLEMDRAEALALSGDLGSAGQALGRARKAFGRSHRVRALAAWLDLAPDIEEALAAGDARAARQRALGLLGDARGEPLVRRAFGFEAGPGRLAIMPEGTRHEYVVVLGGTLSVGRGLQADVLLVDEPSSRKIGRHHCRLRPTPEGWMLDLQRLHRETGEPDPEGAVRRAEVDGEVLVSPGGEEGRRPERVIHPGTELGFEKRCRIRVEAAGPGGDGGSLLFRTVEVPEVQKAEALDIRRTLAVAACGTPWGRDARGAFGLGPDVVETLGVLVGIQGWPVLLGDPGAPPLEMAPGRITPGGLPIEVEYL